MWPKLFVHNKPNPFHFSPRHFAPVKFVIFELHQAAFKFNFCAYRCIARNRSNVHRLLPKRFCQWQTGQVRATIAHLLADRQPHAILHGAKRWCCLQRDYHPARPKLLGSTLRPTSMVQWSATAVFKSDTLPSRSSRPSDGPRILPLCSASQRLWWTIYLTCARVLSAGSSPICPSSIC